MLLGTPFKTVSASRSSFSHSSDQFFEFCNSGSKSVCGIVFGTSTAVGVPQPGKQTIALSAQIVVLSLSKVDRVGSFREIVCMICLCLLNDFRLGFFHLSDPLLILQLGGVVADIGANEKDAYACGGIE